MRLSFSPQITWEGRILSDWLDTKPGEVAGHLWRFEPCSKLRQSNQERLSNLKVLFSLLFNAADTTMAAPAPPDPLAGQVTIYRDNYGTPHIVGETEEATFFGYGYAQ